MSRFHSRALRVRVTVSATVLVSLYASLAIAHADSAPSSFKLSYESAFSNYRPLGDFTVGTWRDANDNVTRIGGWREYLKEVQRSQSSAPSSPVAPPQSTPSRASAPSAKPTTPDPHAGHRRP
jgi:hypothetical protein